MKRKSSEIISNSNDDDDEHTICLRSDKCVIDRPIIKQKMMIAENDCSTLTKNRKKQKMKN